MSVRITAIKRNIVFVVAAVNFNIRLMILMRVLQEYVLDSF